MKKYIGLIIGIIILVGVLSGAGILYSSLSKEYKPQNQLMVTTPETENAEAAEGENETAEAEDEATESEGGNTEEDTEVLITTYDFPMEDAEGNVVNLSDFIGKPIVLNFWASWCGPCKMELPDFQKAYETYGEEVQFLFVNMTDGGRETKETAMEYLEKESYDNLPVYYDTTQMASYTYAVYSIPTTYFFDAEGKLVAGARGMVNGDALERGIEMIYAP